MKYVMAFVAAMALSVGVNAASLNLYGGTGQTGTESVSSAGVLGGTASAGGGIAGTTSRSVTRSNGSASAIVTPVGTATTQVGRVASTGGSLTGTSGSAIGGSVYGGGGVSASGANSSFGTVGLGFLP